jgi:tetratricopeptide (TPR) repeat protein
MRHRALFIAGLALAASWGCPGEEQGAAEAYRKGLDAFRAASYAEAADAMAIADSQAHGFQDALLVRARALIHLDRYREAEASLRQYINVHADAADAKFLLGYVLFREDRPEQSLAIYTAAAELQRPVPDDFKVVGLDYVLLNDYPDAIRWLERSVQENPKDAEAVYYLGRAYYAQNWFEKAIAQFQQALALNPLFVRAENNLGLALAAQNKLDLAEQAYRRAIQMGEEGEKRSEQPYINLGELLIDHNRVLEALELLNAAKNIDPKADRVDQLRGRALLAENRYAEAEEAFRAAIALKPDSGVLHYQLGRVLKRLGRDEEARQEFARSKALLGTHSALPY